eukprot:s1_g680.t1
MSTPERASIQIDAAPIFAALGDQTRLALIQRLSDGTSLSIAELTDGFNLTRQGVTKHLRVLGDAGLVSSDRVGRETRFTLVPTALQETQAYLSGISEQWDRALSRLKTFVED